MKLKPISIRGSSELSEKWVQDQIAEDPAVLGLGDLILRDRERIQPRAGRLDLLLQDPESLKRFEVEIQLGATDESHMIRTIEYWDIERKRYPQYEHVAVIVAEEITSRFLNVINLFNGHIPLIALKMTAYKIDDNFALTFVKVLDELTLGLVDEDEVNTEPTDRAYWEKRATKSSLSLTDQLLGVVHEINPDVKPNYNRHYVGLQVGDSAMNFVYFQPRKAFVITSIKLPQDSELTKEIEDAGFDTLDYDSRTGRYRLKNSSHLSEAEQTLLKKLLAMSHDGFRKTS